jgi:hypothetical protein
MRDHIGETAGRVWQLLQQRNEITISQIPKALGEPPALTYQALGWLAREGKVEYRTVKKTTYVSLAPAEVAVF